MPAEGSAFQAVKVTNAQAPRINGICVILPTINIKQANKQKTQKP